MTLSGMMLREKTSVGREPDDFGMLNVEARVKQGEQK